MRFTRRDYCVCTEVRNWDLEQAAEKLKCRVRFLEDNLATLPHQKLGRSVAFCDCELRLIQGLFSVLPELPDDVLPGREPVTQQAPVAALAAIKPSATRRRSAVG
ncbi:hypothetical protein AQJ30_15875 [Streptomyces longwoodensis]|uniref:Uncharacterized protein n=1 Tax=Streptomyces longwoodensis TaxID=68231 RepID=A0A101QXK5_9ACTN|nr:hypothetical protein [Streptomyces longwoodensis]KUN37758.1 hypothetical protein AQJ30_15875 [Streptomyces longwoodensis]